MRRVPVLFRRVLSFKQLQIIFLTNQVIKSMYERLESINRIILSIGHGGMKDENKFDSGAVNEMTNEKENTEASQIALKVAGYLRDAGLIVLLMPDFSLGRTIEIINSKGDSDTDWAFEIHKDSSTSFSTAKMGRRMGIYYHPTSKESKEIAEDMIAHLRLEGAHSTSWARPDTASNHGSLAWLRKPKMLSHLIEAGFIQDNNNEVSDNFYATVIAKTIGKMLGVQVPPSFSGQ